MIGPASAAAAASSNPTLQEKTKKTPLTKALQDGERKLAITLLEAAGQEATFTPTEMWQIRAFKNLAFSDADFLALDPKTQRLVYRTANNCGNIPFAARLNALGMLPPAASILVANLINQYMDIATIHHKIMELLAQLRAAQRLSTAAEFEQQGAGKKWITKYNFTRILGTNHLSRLIQELGLKSVKVPLKIVVLKPEVAETIPFDVRSEGYRDFGIFSDDIRIEVQQIQPVERFLSREEIRELFILIEAANYTDLWDHNFIVAQDGIYFIDNEFKSFSHSIEWGKIARLDCYVAPEDQEWFKHLYTRKINEAENSKRPVTIFYDMACCVWEDYQQKLGKEPISERYTAIAKECKQVKQACKLVGSHHTRVFTLSVKEILTPQP